MSQSVLRALKILREIGSDTKSSEELAEVLSVHRTTAYRLVQILISERFVAVDGKNRYRLGPALFALAHQALDGLDLRNLAEPHLTKLNQKVGHTIHLASYNGNAVVYIDKRETSDSVRMSSRIGNVAPTHCTAVGKAIVAFQPLDEIERILETIGYQRYTERTVVSKDELRAELDTTREQGFATDDREHEPFVSCIAAPIFTANNSVLGAISISTTTVIRDIKSLLTLAPLLLETAHNVSSEFGWESGGSVANN